MGFPGIAPTVPLEEASRSPNAFDFETVRGRRIHFRAGGQGPAIVFLHGLAASSFSFRDLLPLLEEDFRVIAVDLNGFGFSERAKDPDSYELGEQASAVVQLLDRLGVDRARVFGHSLGAVLAVRMAVTHPDRVSEVFLASPVSEFKPPPWYLRNGISLQLFYFATRVLLSRPERFRKAMGRAFFREASFTDEISEEYRRQLLVAGFRSAFHGYAVALSRERDLSHWYEQLSQRVVIFGGERDEIVPPDSLRRLQGLIPGAELNLLPDCGHSAPEEWPGEIAMVVRSVLLESDA